MSTESGLKKLITEIESYRENLSDTRYSDEHWFKINQKHLGFLEDLYFEFTQDINIYGSTL